MVDGRVVKIRVIANPEMAEETADGIVDVLEKAGCEVIELTNPKPRREPEENLATVYLTALRDSPAVITRD